MIVAKCRQDNSGKGHKPAWSAPAHPGLHTPLTGEDGQTARRSANPPPKAERSGGNVFWSEWRHF
jgi:hypothetical protein